MRVYARTAMAVAGLVLATIIGVVLSPSSAAAATKLKAYANPSMVQADPGDHGTIKLGASVTGSTGGTMQVTLALDVSDLPQGVTVSGCGSGGSNSCPLSLNPPGPQTVSITYHISSSAKDGADGSLRFTVTDASDTSDRDSGAVTFDVGSQPTVKGSLSSAKVGGTTTASATVGGLSSGRGFSSFYTLTIVESDSAHALQAVSGSGCNGQGNTYTCGLQRGASKVSVKFKVVSCGVKGDTRSSITVSFTLKSGGFGGSGGSTLAKSTATLHPTGSGCTVTPSPSPSLLPSGEATIGIGPTNIVSTGAVIAAPTGNVGAPLNASDVTSAGANPVLVGIAIVAVLGGIIAVGMVGLRMRRPLFAADGEATGAYPTGGFVGEETREYSALGSDDDEPDDDEPDDL